jgi:hypothetical protein
MSQNPTAQADRDEELYTELASEIAEEQYQSGGMSDEAIKQHVEAAGVDYADWLTWNEEQIDRMAPNL